MSKLPRVSGEQVVAALLRIGFRVRRQHGSHIIMRRDEPFAQTVEPFTSGNSHPAPVWGMGDAKACSSFVRQSTPREGGCA
jgi:predicted RNA binding protein YcfA (HicA-like mRNA interferase family)